MKNSEIAQRAAAALEALYETACRWEEEPECFDPWQHNCDI